MNFEYDEKEGDNLATGEFQMPYPINVGGPQLVAGRTRRCGFWISSFVERGMRLIIDTTQLAGGAWEHNVARDVIPHDCLLVVVHPEDAEHIRKAMATWPAPIGPAIVAARIIDQQCREVPELAARMRWKVR